MSQWCSGVRAFGVLVPGALEHLGELPRQLPQDEQCSCCRNPSGFPADMRKRLRLKHVWGRAGACGNHLRFQITEQHNVSPTWVPHRQAYNLDLKPTVLSLPGAPSCRSAQLRTEPSRPLFPSRVLGLRPKRAQLATHSYLGCFPNIPDRSHLHKLQPLPKPFFC